VRPGEIMMVILGVILGLAGFAFGIVVFADRSSGRFWFYWIAPLLAFGFGSILISLSVGYYRKVGRLEMKGRPRSD
jgi:hypothetical protein